MGKSQFAISLNDEQKKAKAQILRHPFNFIFGAAGSGKTLLSVQIAADRLLRKEIDKIIITRPTISTEDNGYLPGTFEEKMEPWMIPIKHNFYKLYRTDSRIEKLFENKDIEMVSLTHFRGRTFENSYCIVDEFQNLSKQQLTMALGRLGKNSTMIFTGDNKQIDLRHHNDSAVHTVPLLEKSKHVFTTTLEKNHRHPAVFDVLNILRDNT